MWEELKLFVSEKKVPEDGFSLAGDIIRINQGEHVSRDELKT